MMDGSQAHSLTVVIPALNEEKAIGPTIQRCLEARRRIEEQAGLARVEFIVVSDGSSDRTVEIARGFAGVKLIVFECNKGYGAAIKEGWNQGTGDLLGFMDADGTCDPEFFGAMCQAILDENADVVLGSRLGPDSRMPAIRRLGNRIYATLLGFLCGFHVSDTASGMRVVRRSSLKYLYPLPDRLHFTPSMSARALLNNLRVVELPMKYEERIGESKLNVIRDGVQFLQTILSGVLCYQPENIFLGLVSFSLLILVVLAAYPVEFYFQNRRLEEWMIYRFVVCWLLGAFSLLLLLSASLANHMSDLGPRRRQAIPFWPRLIAMILQGWGLSVIVIILGLAGTLLLWPGIVEYVSTRHISLHWSRLLSGAFAFYSMLQTIVFAVLLKTVSLWVEHRRFFDREAEKGQNAKAESNPESSQPVARSDG
jgi:glycosyltransferase involved in cell wall biosynthesis